MEGDLPKKTNNDAVSLLGTNDEHTCLDCKNFFFIGIGDSRVTNFDREQREPTRATGGDHETASSASKYKGMILQQSSRSWCGAQDTALMQ
ncbi:unnamed protein product, partial [Nesidiocoris tenuis]